MDIDKGRFEILFDRIKALEAHNAKHFEQLNIGCKMCKKRYPHEQLRGTPPICPNCHTDGRD